MFDTRYKFTAKELDNETSYTYFGARYYDTDLSVWLSVDPMSDKYPSISPYCYSADNPVVIVDPNGNSWEPIDENGETVNINDKEKIHGYRWVDYDIDVNGNKISKPNTVETAYTFGAFGMTILSSEGYEPHKKWIAYENLSTGYPITDKRISLLHPKIQNQVKSFILMAKYRFDIDLRITQGYRSIDEQNNLYEQGRTKPGNIVTQAKGGYSAHNFGLAIDIVPIENGNPNWNSENWDIIGRIGESRGLEWGGRWDNFTDKPHFQNLFNKTLKEIRNLPKNNDNYPVF
jgi:RHS repeat-associated protein